MFLLHFQMNPYILYFTAQTQVPHIVVHASLKIIPSVWENDVIVKLIRCVLFVSSTSESFKTK